MATLGTNIGTTTVSSVAAYFSSDSAAHQAVNDLKTAGFNSSQIGYAARPGGIDTDNYSAGEYGGNAAAGDPTSVNYGNTNRVASTTKAKAEGTWDKIKNFFEGNEPEPYADERARNSTDSHEITARGTTTGATTTPYDDYNANDLQGTFNDLSVSESRSRYFGHRLGYAEGGAIVTVRANGREAEAEEILVRNGGDIGNDADNYAYPESTQTTAEGGNQRIQLLGEVLRVHKERINRGEVRLRKEVITETQTIQVPVTREELVLERVPVDSTTPVSGTIGAESEIRIPLSEERAAVDKQTVVREEVVAGKRQVEEVHDLDSEVAHEELRVEDSTGSTTNKY